MDQDLRNRIDRVIQTIWSAGSSEPTEYIEQASYLIYLKLLDEEENDRELQTRLGGSGDNAKSLFPGQAKRYRWSQWRFKSGNELLNFVRDDVFPYLGSLVKEAPSIARYFQDSRLTISDPTILKTVVDELDAIEFRKLGPDVKGDIFEYLLQFMATSEAANFGQFRTPKQIRNFMVRMVDPDYTDTVYDPSCGTAGFLIDAVDHVLAKYSETPAEYPIYGESWLANNGYANIAEAKEKVPNLQTYRKGPGDRIPDWELLEHSVYGHDVSQRLVRISMMNLVLHGLRKAKVRKANSLSETTGLTEEERDRRYKVILSNPPFAGQLPRDSVRTDLPTNSKKTELLFFSLVMQSLAPGGRCAVVLPEGVLFGSTTAHKELRKKLFDEYEVLAVVSLNNGVFKPYAGVKTSVLVFSKPAEDQAPKLDKVWFYEVRNDGYDPDKVSGGGRVETPLDNQIPQLLDEWSQWKQSGFTEAPGAQSAVLLDEDTPEPQSWWADKSLIEENDYNLSASRYKPQRPSQSLKENPADLIRDTLQDERAIKTGLENLLEDL